MNLSNLKYPKGARQNKKRVGRGQGSGHGGTSCKGHKGQKSRSGYKNRAWFEGGQMPIQRRLPKRGFTNIFRTEYSILNLKDLARLEKIDQVTPEVLVEKGLLHNLRKPVKILGVGELAHPIEISANAFSKSAKEKIEAAGGKAVVI